VQLWFEPFVEQAGQLFAAGATRRGINSFGAVGFCCLVEQADFQLRDETELAEFQQLAMRMRLA
jgi:hypothetical protein